MSVFQRYNPYFKQEFNNIHNNDGIIDLSKVDNSIFGIGCQINKLKISNEQSVIKKIIDVETGSIKSTESTYSSTSYSSDSKSTKSTISTNSLVEICGEMSDSSELTDSDELSSYKTSPTDFTYLPNIKYVKKYFLGSFFSGDELNIIDEKNIDALVFFAKLIPFIVTDGVDNIIHEIF